jgi:hypothetical protein
MKMARAKKTTSKAKKNAELAPMSDPRAPLDGAAFLKAAQRVLRLLADDLAKRATTSPAVTATLKARHAAEVEARRTADALVVWQQSFVEQVAAAWLLSCVFARVLEDRGLLGRARIAGPGATDSQHLFLELAPSLTERDYLLTVFRELSRFAAARDLFDARHNPVWLLAPSAEVTKELLALFRTPNANEPAFRFGASDTRFLGDLYQDLSEDVKKRFALLQTPRFVESFILDRTLERAIERFGLNETTLIDPTCGSGHFLLGAFERLFDHRLRAEPGLEPREAARKALDAVFGADINPYAVAIARFRLTLAYLEKAGFTRLKDAPALPLHLVVADSLLHNPHIRGDGSVAAQKTFGDLDGQSRATWDSDLYQLEDEVAARGVLNRRYAAVVGNPPYITVKDAVLRERYREMYSAAAGKYSLAAPFAQRFFQLACNRGAVGMITANSFMKREFGKKLIEDYLPSVNLDLVVNTSGAYIPGHGTPTVLLFGTSEAPQGKTVHTVLASRGEPSTPDEPEQGLVWRSVADHWGEVGFENDYISVMQAERASLAKHPWSLGGGGASELKELLEERAAQRLGEVADSIGIISFTLEDDVFLRSSDGWKRLGVPSERLRPMVVGEVIRDWSVSDPPIVFFPYRSDFAPIDFSSPELRCLWAWRTQLSNSKLFGGKTKVEAGLKWFEYGRLSADKLRTPLSIALAFVATHNHFVLDRGGKVFNRTAPIIKLPESATEDDHFALLAYLNSSTACFWMKQVFFPKTSGTNVGDVRGQADRIAYEFASTGMNALPVPPLTPSLATFGRRLSDLADQRASWAPAAVLARADSLPEDDLRRALAEAESRDESLKRRAIALQEDLDWHVYGVFGLCDTGLSCATDIDLEADTTDRPFARSVAPDVDRAGVWAKRFNAPPKSECRLVEDCLFKRPWFGTQGVFHRDGWTYQERVREAYTGWFAEMVESHASREVNCTTPTVLARALPSTATAIREAVLPAQAPESELPDVLRREGVPFLAAHRFTDAGLTKHAIWEETWALQRREDAGESVGAVPVPPKYDQKDYRDARYWSLRGKLDVPKERFISYPGCDSDEDREPVYGWAGWNHLQRAQALAALYQDRKQREGWSKDRLTPMLAGLLELIPWIKQWHNEPSQEFEGLRLGDYFQSYLEGECRELGLTVEELRAWRPEARGTRSTKRSKAPKQKE